MRKIVGVFLIVWSQLLWATIYTTLYEIEPNDTPLLATPFSGEIKLTGMIKKGDQDAFMWKIDESDSQYSWDIELTGVPNAMTRIDVMKIILTPDGKEVEDYKKFFSFGTRTGNKPIHLKNLLFEKGKYLLALSSKSKERQDTAQSYQIIISKGDKSSEREEGKKEEAHDLYNYLSSYSFKGKEGWGYFEIDKESSQKVWTIKGVGTIGEQLKVQLLDKDEKSITETVTNKFSKYKLEDLELNEGKYYLKYSSDTKDFKSGEKLYSTSRIKIDTNEVEPNNKEPESNVINYKKTIHGTIDKDGDYDFFKFLLSKKLENKVFDITVTTDDKALHFYLKDENGKELFNKEIDHNMTIKSLDLEVEKEYCLFIAGNKKNTKYSFKFSEFREDNASYEVEPNDRKEDAHSINLNRKIEGEFIGDEYDCFSFDIDSPNKLWNINVISDTLDELTLFNGATLEPLLTLNQEDKNNQLKIKNLLLIQGNYRTCIRGADGKYTLLVNEAKLSDLNISSLNNIEHEPNQDESQSNLLTLGQPLKGALENKNNEDYFHFTLKNYEHIRLTATPPKDGDVQFEIISDNITHTSLSRAREAIIENIYPPGRYIVRLRTEKPSYGLYSLKLERLNPFTSMDSEKNDNLTLANRLPYSFNIKGFTSNSDNDYFKFPKSMTKETNVTISGNNIEGNVYFYPKKDENSLSMKWDEENKSYTTTLKTPHSSYFLIESGTGFYEYNLSFTEYQPKPKKELKISLKVNLENPKVTTYSEFGQKINFSIELESLEDYDLNITEHLSDNSWKLDFNKTISIKKSEKKVANFELIIPKNIDKTPVVTTLKFSNKNRDFKTVNFRIEPKENIKPLNPYEDWGIPNALLGGINVARLDFGAKRVVEHNEIKLGYVPDIGEQYHLLFDGMVYKGYNFSLYQGRESTDENVTIKLAGEKENEIVGVILNPLGEENRDNQLKDFSVSLSEDGVTYKTVYQGVLGLEQINQAFVFDKIYVAKYARLTLHNNHNKQTKGTIGIGEWKVIAKQESLVIKNALNIANPKLGGHVVKASQELSGSWDNYILTPIDDLYSSSSLYKEDKKLSWVVGFKNERIAKITEMLWREPKESKKETYMKKVKIFISTTTPNGAWTEMKEWRKGENNQSSYIFEKPIWARYVKFVFPIEKSEYYALPETLQILETKPSNEYKSILGEWGDKNHRSFYEYQQQKNEKTIKVIAGNEIKESAFGIENNKSIQGRVSVANHEEDWYRITIPKNHNQLQLNLSGREGVDVNYELFDNNGTQVEFNQEVKKLLNHHFKFKVQEGNYYLKVKQPPVSVVFAWDNSGSVSPYHKEIFNSVNNYIRTIQPKIDAVNLLCFNTENQFILNNFSDKSNQIEGIFNNFNRACGDSDAERPLRISSEKLKNREGTKGVIIIADAVGNRDIKLWKKLEEVNPKVFSIRVQSQYQENEMYEGIMQSWSRVNNGTYTVVRNADEMYQAINLASAILRRPVYYKVNIQTQYERPLGDGSLKVVEVKSQKQKVNKNFAIELILDASGSMLKRIKGKRRIAIARDVLKKAVKEIIPPKTQVALRVFGHKKADSCRTDLEMSLQPLNIRKTSRIISKINAKNLAKTPIADSLAKVADDLSKVKGKKVIILVTDGEETCDGDPAKEIQTLKDKGIDVRINIVGFAIDDEKLKAQFAQWAELGNGAYFEANDKKSLDEAIQKALQIPFKVYNKKDELVGSGIVGVDELKLKGGTYRVVVETSPEQIFEKVIVKGEALKEIKLGAEK